MSHPDADRAAPRLRATRSADRHLDRLAVVYVRQSTAEQVQRHQESTQLQYALADRAVRLGWPRDRVLVIDDDLGLSGAVGRGPARLPAAAGRGGPGPRRADPRPGDEPAGPLLQGLAPAAGAVRPVRHAVCDADGLYDPTDYNDRLLLGLKGTMSEAELHILRQRMHQGELNKARRGELFSKVPIGYVRTATRRGRPRPGRAGPRPSSGWSSTSSSGSGSAAGLLRWLVEHGV